MPSASSPPAARALRRLLPGDAAVATCGFRPPRCACRTPAVEGDARFGGHRAREFRCGRCCAATALAALPAQSCHVPRDVGGRPIWPGGTTGSITHCAGITACVVSWRDVVLAVGIDAELHLPLPAAVAPVIARPAELHAAAAVGRRRAVHGATVLLSAKEAVVKAAWGLGPGFVEPHRLDVRLADDGTFGASLSERSERAAILGERLTGRWAVAGAHVVATAVVPGRGLHPAAPPRTDDRVIDRGAW